jgi:L-ascorbate metabolism protein UlaG (beta-lactamase superfamily)
MRLTHFGHAAVLIETDSGARVLVDPGTYSEGFESLTGLDLILVTHPHPDHVDAARLAALREANPGAVLIADEAGAAAAGAARPGDRIVSDDAPFEAAGVGIRPIGSPHATIHPDLPPVHNTGFVIDDRVWHPGDALPAESAAGVDVLLLPVGGPWMKVSDAIDFARAVGPRVVVPIHQGGLAEIHRELHYRLVGQLVPAELVVLAEGQPREV